MIVLMADNNIRTEGRRQRVFFGEETSACFSSYFRSSRCVFVFSACLLGVASLTPSVPSRRHMLAYEL